ncbi:hypothetical protein [Streptomyces sp. NPDC001165]
MLAGAERDEEGRPSSTTEALPPSVRGSALTASLVIVSPDV